MNRLTLIILVVIPITVLVVFFPLLLGPFLQIDTKVNITILVSLFSFIWSAIWSVLTFYYNSIKQGQIVTISPRYIVITSLGLSETINQTSLLLPLSFANTGAKQIVIEDVFMKSLDKNGIPRKFIWHGEPENLYFWAKWSEKEELKINFGNPFSVSGYNSESKNFQFVENSDNSDGAEPYRLPEGPTQFEIFCRIRKKWVSTGTFDILLSKIDVEDVNRFCLDVDDLGNLLPGHIGKMLNTHDVT